jgi:hypothetical protein
MTSILWWSLLVYLTVMTLVNSPVFLNGIVGWIKHVQFLPLLPICEAIGLRPSLVRRVLVPYLLVLLVLVSLPALWTLTGASGTDVLGLQIYARPGPRGRYVFAFDQPNILGLFLVCTMVLAGFALASQLRTVRVAVPAAGALGLGCYVLVMTMSRRSLLLLPLVAAVGVLLQRGRGRRVRAAGLGLVVVACLCVLLVILPSAHDWTVRWGDLLEFTGDRLAGTGPIDVRSLIFQRVASSFHSPLHWLFGQGAGTLGFAPRHYIPFSLNADGYYAVLMGEYGLLGLALYVTLFAAVFSRLVRGIVGRSLSIEREDIVVGIVASSLAVAVGGVAGNTNTTFPLVFYIWAYPGAALCMLRPQLAESAIATDRLAGVR